MMMMVVVVLRGGVVVVVVMMLALDVSVGKEEGRCGRRRLLGRRHACRQGPVALDGAVPTRRPQLGGGGKEGVEHSNAHMRLILSMIAALHIGLDTLLEHKVREVLCLSFS